MSKEVFLILNQKPQFSIFVKTEIFQFYSFRSSSPTVPLTEMAESYENVPLPVSTVQEETEFVFDRFLDKQKEREFYLGPVQESTLIEKVSQYYSVDKLVDFFAHSDYKLVTLQFPDHLVLDASIVLRLLQDKLPNIRFYILADTAYSACCVDEIAAEHVNGDVVVHFGDACLNAIEKLPTVYIMGKPVIHLDSMVESFTGNYPKKDDKICLMSNTPYNRHLYALYGKLVELGYTNIIFSQLHKDIAGENAHFLDIEEQTDNYKKLFTLGNRELYGSVDMEEFDDEYLQSHYKLFFVTVPQDPFLLYLTTKFSDVALYDVHNKSINNGPFPSMMKRYKFMNVARTAGCIGILINTLSLRNTKDTINKLIKLIKLNGKKHYLFVVGKPNVAKLANFETVDIWCILGCGQSGIIIDQFNEFYKPIITPYELTLALNKDVTWTGKWVTDFQNALKDIEDEINDDENNSPRESNNQTDFDDDAPEFDVVTGKYVSTSRPLRALNHLEIESPTGENQLTRTSKDLIQNVTGGAIIKGTVSTSVARLQERHWSGLGTDFKDDEEYEEDGATVEEGISGVARGYEFDRHDAFEKSQNK